MLKQGATGSLTAHHIEQGKILSLIASGDYYFIYLASGEANYDNTKVVNAGDLLQIQSGKEINLSANESCRFIEIIVILGV